MSKETDAITKMLQKYVGNAAGLYLLREMEKLDMDADLSRYPERKKLILISAICMHILGPIVSVQKIGMIKSRLYSILDMGSKFDSYMSVESLDWTIVFR